MGEFVNTFQNGMNQDNNVNYQPEGTYRFANNLQLVNVDGNNLTLKDSYGNREIVLLDVPFASIAGSPPSVSYATEPMPLAFVSFPDGRLVLFHTNSESSTGGGGEIGQMYLTNIGESVDAENQTILSQTFAGYVPLYYHDALDFSKMYKIEGFGFKENDEISRIYWTDNFNEPRVFNISNPIFSTYITSGSLITGKQYMVTSGAIEYPPFSGIYYGKGLATGNVFTATALGGNTYTNITGNVLVIEYFPYQLLSWQPSRSLGNITFNSYGNGVKRCGSNVYFYRLGIRSEGYFTSWSYGSAPIHVGVQNSLLSGNTYQDFVGNGASTGTPIISNKSVKIDINNIDTNFDVIQLASADYDNLYTTPYSISIVQDMTITGTSMTIEDFGNINLGTLTLDDITLFPASILKCKTITTDKNYNVIANITERTEVDFDKSTVSISSFEYRMPVYGNDQSCNNLFLYDNVLPTAQLAGNPAAGTVRPYSRWLVVLGNNTTDTVSYNNGGVPNYVTGDVIVGVNSGAGVNFQNSITTTGSALVVPCVNLNKYNVPINASASVISKPNAHQIKTGFWDYKDPLVASTVKGYWSHETYRFGILFYDLKGNPFYVRWIGDYQMPQIVDKLGQGLLIQSTFTNVNDWALNPSLINIDGVEVSIDLASQISGFSIVRAPRDVRIITQGLCIQNDLDTSTTPGLSLVTPSGSIVNTNAVASNIYTWICPDNLVSIPFKQGLAQVGDKMEEAGWLAGLTFTGGVYYRSGNGNTDVLTKQFTPTKDNLSYPNLRSATIINFQTLTESNTVANVFGIANYDYLNYNIDPTAINADGTCTSGAPVALNNRRSIGGKKSIIYMNGIPHYGQWNTTVFPYVTGYDYTASGVVNDKKILMNNVRELANPYGGTGDTALANTLYISTGHFQPITPTVLADVTVLKFVLTSKVGTFLNGEQITGGTSGATGFLSNVIGVNVYVVPSGIVGTFVNGETITGSLSGATGIIKSQATVYLFNGIQVGGGDCFTNLIDYGYGLYDNVTYGVTYPAFSPMSIGYYFPCECNSNYGLRRGTKIANFAMGNGGIQSTTGIAWDASGRTTLEDFSYNPAYSTEGINFEYPALPVDFISTGKFLTRARFAGQKIIGEVIDSFRTFLTNDYIDVDVQLGEINNVKAKGDYVYYWQNHAVGSMPILERQMISQSQGSATSLGTGGVLARFDTISTKYGNQHQWGLTDTEDGWIWFDMRNKDVCIMGFGGSVQEITVPTGMKSYFAQVFLERLTAIFNGTYLNSQTYDASSDRPLMGTGIIGVYDPKNKMSYLTFKFRSYSETLSGGESVINELNKDFTIGFSHITNKFIGFYDKYPAIWHNHGQNVLSANNPKNLNIYYASNMQLPTTVTIGDVIKSGTKEYVAIANGVISSYPDLSLFTEINRTNQIYIENEEQTVTTTVLGYIYNFLYGRVVNSELEIIVNPQQGQISVTNYEMGATGSNITDITVSADSNQTGGDSNIKSTNRDYSFHDGSWWGNLPLSTLKGRITDKYLRIRFTKKNALNNNPTTVDNSKLTTWQYIRSYFESKR